MDRLESFKQAIRATLTSAKHGQTLPELRKSFLELGIRPNPFEEMKISEVDFFTKYPDVGRMEVHNGIHVFFAIPTAQDKHIHKMVQQQKRGKLKSLTKRIETAKRLDTRGNFRPVVNCSMRNRRFASNRGGSLSRSSMPSRMALNEIRNRTSQQKLMPSRSFPPNTRSGTFTSSIGSRENTSSTASYSLARGNTTTSACVRRSDVALDMARNKNNSSQDSEISSRSSCTSSTSRLRAIMNDPFRNKPTVATRREGSPVFNSGCASRSSESHYNSPSENFSRGVQARGTAISDRENRNPYNMKDDERDINLRRNLGTPAPKKCTVIVNPDASSKTLESESTGKRSATLSRIQPARIEFEPKSDSSRRKLNSLENCISADSESNKSVEVKPLTTSSFPRRLSCENNISQVNKSSENSTPKRGIPFERIRKSIENLDLSDNNKVNSIVVNRVNQDEHLEKRNDTSILDTKKQDLDVLGDNLRQLALRNRKNESDKSREVSLDNIKDITDPLCLPAIDTPKEASISACRRMITNHLALNKRKVISSLKSEKNEETDTVVTSKKIVPSGTPINKGPSQLERNIMNAKLNENRALGKNHVLNEFFICGIPLGTTELELRTSLYDYGFIEKMTLKMGYAFVTFSSAEEVRAILKTRYIDLKGTRIECKEMQTRDKLHHAVDKSEPLYDEFLVYVKSVPAFWSDEKLKDVFSSFGNVTNVANSRKGYGFVYYDNKDIAAAVVKQGTLLVQNVLLMLEKGRRL
ncbi:DgyrCDS11922 [Dimorphilus gyrociliatus]|nr:DgyrCDS11922 [Dimorphilus gyrociliatus]